MGLSSGHHADGHGDCERTPSLRRMPSCHMRGTTGAGGLPRPQTTSARTGCREQGVPTRGARCSKGTSPEGQQDTAFCSALPRTSRSVHSLFGSHPNPIIIKYVLSWMKWPSSGYNLLIEEPAERQRGGLLWPGSETRGQPQVQGLGKGL